MLNFLKKESIARQSIDSISKKIITPGLTHFASKPKTIFSRHASSFVHSIFEPTLLN